MMAGGTNCSSEKYVDFLIKNGENLDLLNSKKETDLIIISRSTGSSGQYKIYMLMIIQQ